MSVTFPRTRFVAALALLVLVPTALLYTCYYSLTSGAVVVTGLLIDVVGAVVLVVPDWPALNRRFESGRLKQSQDETLKPFPGWVVADPDLDDEHLLAPARSPTFDDLLHLIREQYEASDNTSSEIVWDSVDTINPDEYEFHGDETRKALHLTGDGIDNDVYFELEPVQYFVRERIRELDSRFRRSGIFLILLGFSIQALGTAFISP